MLSSPTSRGHYYTIYFNILYQSLSFLMDEGIASVEIIGQSVMLNETNVKTRDT
mgnify:CR=1 FL=1